MSYPSFIFFDAFYCFEELVLEKPPSVEVDGCFYWGCWLSDVYDLFNYATKA
jgi:hypothetical protein